MMFKCIFYICKIFTFSNYLYDHGRISLIVDRKIQRMVNEDGSEAKDLFLRDDIISNQNHASFLFDRNFPQPFFHFIECEKFLYSRSDSKQIFKCLSNQKETIFYLEIEKNAEMLLIVNFYDVNQNNLDIERTNNSGHEFMVSNKRKNLQSLNNSLNYVFKIDQLRNEYMNVIGWFSTFLKSIRILMKSAVNLLDLDQDILAKIWEVQKYAVEMTNMLFKSLATLRIPGLDKFEYIKPYDEFIKNMDELADMINELITTFENNISYNDTFKVKSFVDVFELFVKDAKSFVKMLESDYEASLADRYYNLLISLDSFAAFKKGDKDNENTEITLDCDAKKIDKFVEKYYKILFEYCEILNSSDEVLLSEYYYDESLKGNCSYMNSLIEMYFDILVAKEMKRYLSDYHSDKTDFSIFSQTDYFKNKLSRRIKDNLDSLSSALNYKKQLEETIKRTTIELSGDDINYLKKTEDLSKKFSELIDNTNQPSPHSFEFVVSNMTIEVFENDKNEDISMNLNGTEQEKDQITNNTRTEIIDTEQERKQKNKYDLTITDEFQVNKKEKFPNNFKNQNNDDHSMSNNARTSPIEKENNFDRYILFHYILATLVTLCLLGLLSYIIVYKIERKVTLELDPNIWKVPEKK